VLDQQEVADDDFVSRHIYSPRMGSASAFVWHQVFEFPSDDGRRESVVWRKVARLDDEVHEIGLKKAAAEALVGKAIDYIGFLTSLVEPIRTRRTTRGHYFEVRYAPDEGKWHCEIRVVVADDIPNLTKGDKSDIREIMKELFEPHFTAV
jgi:hypothetical protein